MGSVPPPDELLFQRFGVEVLEGDDVGKRVISERSELSIGTAPGNDLVLSDATVSRFHCVIEVCEEGFLLTDLDSLNGTKLGGYRVQAAYLRNNASLKLGRIKVRFVRLEGEVRGRLSQAHHFGEVIGRSPGMRRIFAGCERVAPSSRTVLLEGEAGTGKKLLAKAIHDASPRASKPFRLVDCAAIPATRLPEELFGPAGALLGVNGGTVCLTEIGELSQELQPRLLGAIEERSITGSDGAPQLFDVRIIAATTRDLRPSVNRGHFGADLYRRLSKVRLVIPPLRERREDVDVLVRCYLPEGMDPPPELLASTVGRIWPGNARELRRLIERWLEP